MRLQRNRVRSPRLQTEIRVSERVQLVQRQTPRFPDYRLVGGDKW
jgi:hypothetical protein